MRLQGRGWEDGGREGREGMAHVTGAQWRYEQRPDPPAHPHIHTRFL